MMLNKKGKSWLNSKHTCTMIIIYQTECNIAKSVCHDFSITSPLHKLLCSLFINFYHNDIDQ